MIIERRSPQLAVDSVTIFDALLISRMRLILALASLVVLFLDSSKPGYLATITYAIIFLYVVYSFTLYWLAKKQHRIFQIKQGWLPWADMCWYAIPFMFGAGPGGLFVFGFLFSILSASFSLGTRSGLAITTVTVVIFTIIGLFTYVMGGVLELNRFLMRPIYMSVFGCLFSYWGGFELSLKERLTFLKNISRISNPRLGYDRMIVSIMTQVQAYFRADACLCLQKDSTQMYRLHRVSSANQAQGAHAESLTMEQVQPLLTIPEKVVVAYSSGNSGWWPKQPTYFAYGLDGMQPTTEGRTESETLAGLLGAECFLSAPLVFRNELLGRVYLIGLHRYDGADAQFLSQVLEQVLPIIDNVRLVDQLATSAAEEERRRIARDIHDSIIQPYIGLQLGLTALHRKLVSGELDSYKDAEKMIELTDIGITDLRRYVSALKEGGGIGEELVGSLRRFVAKFTDATGIVVRVNVESEISVKNKLADEIFQMAVEGLSNVRWHTQANEATVTLNCRQNLFTLSIENRNELGLGLRPFVPRSITERAESLNGQARVDISRQCTTVVVEIPI